tara:strand:+ start:2640 stop:4388 length:1749 start_codon:yes stop_codon:yes gene_type:complete
MSGRARRFYTGQQIWERWEKAGVVGTKLRFTDDDIVTQQTLARTADVMKNCRAMDAAVAYELGSVGADTEGVSPKDLLSDYTRAAYLIEDSRAIGYGMHSDMDAESCGHDEVNVTVYKFNKAEKIRYFKDADVVVVDVSGSKINETHLNAEVFKDLSDVTKYRLLNGCRRDFMHNMGDTVAKDTDTPMEVYKKYLSAICPSVKQYLDAGAAVKSSGGQMFFVDNTLGQCKKKEGEKCRHHDKVTTTGWAMYVVNGEMQELYTNAPCSSNWNDNMLQQRGERTSGSKVIPATGKPCYSTKWVSWDSQRRSMLRKVDDKKVLSMIRKALGRMSRRNWGIVRKMYLKRCGDCGSTVDHLPSATNCSACDSENLVNKQRGNNAIYKWKDWGWLANVHAHIQTTRTKNRKAGDVENGWEWYAYETKQSYGMDMSNFAWRPAEENDLVMHTFKVSTRVKSYYGYSTNDVLDFSKVLLFHTKEAAKAAATQIVNGLLKTDGAVVKNRVYTEGEFAPRPNYTVTYTTVSSAFQMKAEIDPEDYMSPKEVNKLFVTAAPSVLENHKDKFMSWSTPVKTKTVAAPKKEGDEE